MAKGIQKLEGKGAPSMKVSLLLCRARWKRVEMDFVLGWDMKENHYYIMV